jgi:hypothetical protein
MLTNYFRYINYERSSQFPGFYLLHYRDREYFACAYGDRYLGKMQIVEILKYLYPKKNLNSREFDFHHIVERPHLADISVAGSTVNDSYPGMPAVMIHKPEHYRYNSILHAAETRELYMRQDINLPDGVEESERVIRGMFASNPEETSKEVKTRIHIMKGLYEGAYEGNDLLSTVSDNILNEYGLRLKPAAV